ncbi:hypothetical protein [Noviherbaspirillum suwonense]|uniref:hypothetical protein n=1 Tax=Noviherbaspirillum suwonense TaxID=1224511 RepID=UPI0024B80F27|nr:hypothetical protein [Noviherbaspirillum suwonense]
MNGIPSDLPRDADVVYLWFDPQGVWRLNRGDLSYELDAVCVRLHNVLRKTVMQGVPYDELLPRVPQFVSLSGLNSESILSKDHFEKFIKLCATFPELNRFLYLYEVQKLISSIQESLKELLQMVGEFYRTLNTEGLFYPPIQQEDGIRFNTSPTVTKLFALLTFVFVRMHSLLDYIVKLAIETEHLPPNFTKYHKMRSLNDQFGSRKKISFNKSPKTLFEECEFITTIETLRNHLIHDGLLDDMPKAYEQIEQGRAVERFILFPDMTHGRFDRYGNRNLFFSKENKINKCLPEIVTEFQLRLKVTLEMLLTRLADQ